MAGKTILVADDDPLIISALSYQLQKEGFIVVTAIDGQNALEQARKIKPDLLLLDVMMPKMDGLEVCRTLRHESNIPILMLTARGEELDRVLGLELGADDYIIKPFSFRELLARIRANLRRVTMTAPIVSEDIHPIGNLTIDLRRYTILRDNESIHLSQREYDLFVVLFQGQGAVIERDILLDNVWGKNWVGDSRTLDVHIRWLREKLEANPAKPRFIHTVRGVGYRLITNSEFVSYEK